jgi:hypothetical protein
LHAVLHDVSEYPGGTVGRVANGRFQPDSLRLSRDDVQKMVIGQYPASAGAVTMLLAIDADLDEPARYEATIMTLGVLAQRAILAAAHRGLAVFCTPAINDELTFSRLGRSDYGPQTITYVLAIGVRREEGP